MQKIINETEVIAYRYLGEFGFSKEEISPLIFQGKKDLKVNLTKLKALLSSENSSLDDVNNVLHALKGLFFHLGNYAIAEQLNEIRSNLNSKMSLQKVTHLLFDDM